MDDRSENRYFSARSASQKLLIRDIFCILQVAGGNVEKCKSPLFYIYPAQKIVLFKTGFIKRFDIQYIK